MLRPDWLTSACRFTLLSIYIHVVAWRDMLLFKFQIVLQLQTVIAVIINEKLCYPLKRAPDTVACLFCLRSETFSTSWTCYSPFIKNVLSIFTMHMHAGQYLCGPKDGAWGWAWGEAVALPLTWHCETLQTSVSHAGEHDFTLFQTHRFRWIKMDMKVF